MSRKAASPQHRRDVLEAFFHDLGSFLLLKEIEKAAAKKLQLRAESIVEILEELVSDGVIQKAKVGLQNVFWSFAADARKSREQRITRQSNACSALRTSKELLIERLSEGRLDRSSCDTRSHLLERTKPKHANLEAKRRQLNRVNIADPLVLELKGRETNQDEISFGQD